MNNDVITMNNIVSIRNLKKFYDNGETKALNGINLDIKRGEFVSIIGPSGSGKSTLLNMIGALDKADSGDIVVDGIDLNDKKENLNKFRLEKIGFIFQLHNLIPNLSVIENVEIPLLGRYKRINKENRKKAEELLRSVNLEDKIKQNPTKMSGGQRQRVAIARALINDPSIIIADEPTGALDTKTSATIIELLKKLHREKNVTLIIVTHDPTIARQADRTITVRDGQIIENIEEIENIDEENPADFIEYVTENKDVFGTNSRKKIVLPVDNRKMELMIRPLSSTEIRYARQEEEKMNGTFQENIMQLAAYSNKNKKIPLKVIQENLPSGLVDEVAAKIIEYSRYGFK